MTKKSKAYAFTLVVLSIAITLVMADLLSSLITIGNFAFLPTQGVKASSYNIYAISLSKSSTLAQANAQIQDIRLKGGAGYVYNTNGLYYLLASAYENENDAIKVKENLENQQLTSEVLKIEISEISIDLSLNGSEKSALNGALNSFKTTYKTLYDISISLDTQVKTLPESKLLVSNYVTALSNVQKEFDTLFKNKLTNEIFQIKLKITALLDIVKALSEQDYEQITLFSAAIKNSYIGAVITNKELAKELSA